jgi:alkaline phosphatase
MLSYGTTPHSQRYNPTLTTAQPHTHNGTTSTAKTVINSFREGMSCSNNAATQCYNTVLQNNICYPEDGSGKFLRKFGIALAC